MHGKRPFSERNFFEVKIEDLKSHPENDHLTSLGFWAGITNLQFLLRKNSTRKKVIFHPEKSHAWKKAIFRVEFFFKKFFTELENGQSPPEIQNSMLLTWKILGLIKIFPGKSQFSMHGIYTLDPSANIIDVYIWMLFDDVGPGIL